MFAAMVKISRRACRGEGRPGDGRGAGWEERGLPNRSPVRDFLSKLRRVGTGH